jgi:hypothetical protein
MIQTLRLSDFTNAFRNSDRKDQFSYEAQTILFDYFEALEDDLGTPIEFDMIGICCEWAENTPEELCYQYPIFEADVNDPPNDSSATDLIVEWLNDRTQVAGVTAAGTIVYCSSF